MSDEKNLFQHIEATSSRSITVGDGKALRVEGTGSVSLCSSKGKITILNDVQFVPNRAHNLLSVGQIMDSGYDVEFTKGVFIGYSWNSRAYKIMDPDSKCVHVSRNVHFFEEKQWDWLRRVTRMHQTMIQHVMKA